MAPDSPKEGRPAHFLREWREARGYTLDELSRRMGRPKSLVSRIETGERALTMDNALAAAKALGIFVGLLFRKPGERPLHRDGQLKLLAEAVDEARENS